MGRILKDYDDVALPAEDLAGRIDWAGLFGRAGSVHVEVGSGKGTFLVHEAKAYPAVDFLGIEWARKYYRHAVDRIGRWGLSNVRITRADAVTFLSESVPDASVDCFHIYFPDPWPKKRHHRRRFVQSSTMAVLVRCLKDGGEIRLATDHAEYFAQMQEVASGWRGSLEEIAFTRPAGAEDGELTGTNYERKYLRDERRTHTLALRKR
jgi:tRNA (guanine-N7-)-methyltransferase